MIVRIALVLAGALAAGPVPAQSIYKCPLANGSFQYTDVPCTGPHAQVVHKATQAEIATKRNTTDSDVIAYMLRNGRVTQAQQYATTHHQEKLYNNTLAQLQQEVIATHEQQQREAAIARQMERLQQQAEVSSLQQQVVSQQQALDQQGAALQYEQQRSSTLRARARAAQSAAAAAAAEASTPKFNPQSGKWCQQTGAVLNCW